MKESIKTIFIILGSVIGAGFISGRELVRFFGDAYPPFLLLAVFLFAFYIFILLRVGNKYGGFAGFCEQVFGKRVKIVKGIFYVSSFITVTAMLAGINALEESYAPFIAILSAVLCFLIVCKGIGGVGVFNLFLVPAILLYVFVCLWKKGEFLFIATSLNPGMGALFCLLYVCMNLFLSASVLLDCGAGLKKGWFLPTAGVSAGILGVCIALVLSAITSQTGAKELPMPLMSVLDRSGIYPLICYFGIMTTLISAYYPLHAALSGVRQKNAARLGLLVTASVFSLWGLKDIVEFAYPFMGALGLIFSTICVFYDDFFQKFYRKIHNARQKAQNQRGRHDEV